MNQKFSKNKYHANANVKLKKENVIPIKIGITINADASVKKDCIWNPTTCSWENGK